MVSKEKAEQELRYFIRDKLFSKEYKIYADRKLEKKGQQLEKVLLLNKSVKEDNLKDFIIEKFYKTTNLETRLVIVPNEDLFTASYLKKIKLITGLLDIKDKITWDEKKIKFVLERKSNALLKDLKKNFGSCFYFNVEKDEICEKKFDMASLEKIITELEKKNEKEAGLEKEDDRTENILEFFL